MTSLRGSAVALDSVSVVAVTLTVEPATMASPLATSISIAFVPSDAVHPEMMAF